MNSKTHRKANSRTDRKVDRIRTAIVGAVLILAAVVLGTGIWYTTDSAPGTFTAGEHYRVLENAPARSPEQPISVKEFFSYGCVHCRNFDPMIEEWKATLADDVRFERVPATFSPAWNVLAQTYYALQELGALERNHERLFRAIHDTGRQFLTIEAAADFVDGNGTTREAFLETANGQGVASRLREAERSMRVMQVTGVPTVVVADRYVVGMSEGRKTALAIVDHLIELERSGGDRPAPAPEQAAPAAG